MLILYLLTIFLIIYAIFFIKQFYNIVFKGYAPLISTKKKILNKAISNIKINDGNVIYELGCGKADFLKLIETKNLKVKLIGVENLLIPSVLLKLQLFFKHSKIKVIQDDFFKINLEEADIIYCFLNNETMKKLGKKFLNECKKETQIISHKFPILDFKPEKVLREYGSKIYYYKI
ncbi:hypothetical protein KAI92_02190 [Candidatus Parcubacteria bacterium]|nr:hypothetical protein [Candidatus Parcubacteria bacterium]